MTLARRNPRLQLMEQIAWWMDQAFRIPGTRIRIGIEGLVGLIPLGGDLLGAVMHAVTILMATAWFSIPAAVLARMVVNLLLDVTVGAIPVLGDAFDIWFKGSTRNFRLLEAVVRKQERGERYSAAPHVLYIATIFLALCAIVLGLFVGFFFLVRWLLHLTGLAGSPAW